MCLGSIQRGTAAADTCVKHWNKLFFSIWYFWDSSNQTHGDLCVVKLKSGIIVWKANYVHPPSDFDPLWSKPGAPLLVFDTLRAAFLKTRSSLGWTAGTKHICIFPALFGQDFSLMLWVESLANLYKRLKRRGECIWQHFLSLGRPVTGCLDPGNKHISAVRLHRSMNNRKTPLQNHFIFFWLWWGNSVTYSIRSANDTFNWEVSLVHFPVMKVETLPRAGITYPFQRLQEVLSFFELLNTDDNFVSCTFGNIL